MPEVLDHEEVLAFLGGFRSTRDRVLAVLMVGAGLRCEEACNVRVGDVRMDRGTIFVPRGKGGKSRSAIIRPEFRATIGGLCGGRPSDSVFAPTARGGVCCTANVRRAFLLASKWSSVKCHPHLLRHTYAVALARHLPLYMVQRALGHSRATTTDIYLRKVGCDAVAEEGARMLAVACSE